MITLLIIIIAFLLLMLLIIWTPFFRSQNASTTTDEALRSQTNINLYQEHKIEIEKDFQQGAIDEENYQYLLTELDKSLLQDMAANEKELAKITHQKNKLSPLWPAAITLFVLIFSIAFYQQQGSYLKLTAKAQNQVQNTESAEQQALAQVEKIKEALKKSPQDSNLWYSLGQATVSIGDFKTAISAFDKVISIEGKKAELLGAKAQAVYYSNGQKITTDVQNLIKEALALDPLDPSTNVLLGMDSFIQQHYKKAIHYWQIIIDSGRENVNVPALTGAINEAKNRLANLNNSANGVSPELTLKVSLTKEFAQKLAQGEDKTVFIYAIPAEGRRIPLAAMKIKLSDLPTTITLSNAQAMSPQFNLGSADKVNIFAVISQQGTPGIKSGDYKAELNNVAVNTKEAIALVINQLVP